MGNFDSPLGKKNFSSQPLREFDVPDGEDNMPIHKGAQIMDGNAIRDLQNRLNSSSEERFIKESNPSEVEREIMVARESRRNGMEKISEGAKRRIEMLIGITRNTRDVDIEGNVFTLQTLKSKEMRQALMSVAQYDGTIEGPFEMRKQYLARSITHVAGVDINNFLASDKLETKLSFIDELDEPLLNHLYSEYLELTKIAREKYSVKSDEDVKEVLEDLKK